MSVPNIWEGGSGCISYSENPALYCCVEGARAKCFTEVVEHSGEMYDSNRLGSLSLSGLDMWARHDVRPG
jgi:hypothetical protein